MIHILSRQINRLRNDDGRNDRDFSNEENALKAARLKLNDAVLQFSRATRNLCDMVLLEQDAKH